jgi:hypothetical protein
VAQDQLKLGQEQLKLGQDKLVISRRLLKIKREKAASLRSIATTATCLLKLVEVLVVKAPSMLGLL